jgi:hypothetical protein
LGKAMPEVIVGIDKEGNLSANASTAVELDSAGGNRTTAIVRRDVIAVIHTHPYGTGPMPTDADYRIADTLHVPNFELSAAALYVAMPQSHKAVYVAEVRSSHGRIIIKWEPQ